MSASEAEDRGSAQPPTRDKSSQDDATHPLIALAGAVVAGAAAVILTLLEIFLVPLRFDAVQIPLAAVLAFVSNWALAGLIVWWTKNPWSLILPVGIWFVMAVVATMPTTGGSILILATTNGYLFLLAGTAGAAVAIFSYLRPKKILKENR